MGAYPTRPSGPHSRAIVASFAKKGRNMDREIEFECALVGAASFDAAHFSRETFGCTVAVDGGYASLERVGIKPDFALGDFDSLGYVPDGVAVERHPTMKDDSDTALALDWARLKGYCRVAVYGALGGRIDHTLATCQALVGASKRAMQVVAVGEGSVMVPLSSQGFNVLELPAFERGVLSVFSMGDCARDVTESGLKYEVEGIDLSNDVTLGLSNEFVGKPACIRVGSGELMVVLPSMSLSSLRMLCERDAPIARRECTGCDFLS